MKKWKQPIGNTSFGSEEAYEKFVSLPYSEQLANITNGLSPKDEDYAAKLLKGVPNGDSSATAKKSTGDNAKRHSGGSKEADNAKPATTGTES